jgi:predicted dehydrogenase
MASKKNLVVIGYGGMGGWHVEHALKSDVVNLKGIYDIKQERSDLAVSRGIYAYPSREAVLADPEVDLVTVATPNDVHEEIVVDALQKGKNTISEKPVTLNSESLKRMIAASEKSGKIFTVHQNRRWDVDFLAMKQIVHSGEIGELVNIESRIHGSRGIPSDWRGKKEFGGGMIFDWGVHLIDQILQIVTCDIDSINCKLDGITNDECDDGFRLNIYFADKSSAYIEVGTLNFIAMPRFYLRCRNGTALIKDWREPTHVVKCKAWHENDVVPIKTAAGLTKTMAPRDSLTTDEYDVQPPKSDVHDFYRNIVKAIDGTENQLITHPQLLKVMRVMERSFESDKLNQTVKF